MHYWVRLLSLILPITALAQSQGAPRPLYENSPRAQIAEKTKAEKGPLRVGFLYVGPVGDGGWTFAHENGRLAVAKEFGAKVITSYVEKVPESEDAEVVVRELIRRGNQLIFGTTFGYMEPLLKTAAEHSSVKFEHAMGYKTAKNLRVYDARSYEGAYLAGMVAGAMTKSGVLGVVASVPIPEVIRNINSFTLGALSVNPNIKTQVTWVDEWFDPPKEAEAAAGLINAGADILFQTTDSSAVLETAEKMGRRAFGWDSDMSAYGPRAHLASPVINWAPYYIKAVRDVLEDRWTGDSASWWGVKEGAIDIVSLAPDVPASIRTQLTKIKVGLKDGSFAIWKGPLFSNKGAQVLGSGTVADDEFLKGIMFYVRGVEGSVPTN